MSDVVNFNEDPVNGPRGTTFFPPRETHMAFLRVIGLLPPTNAVTICPKLLRRQPSLRPARTIYSALRIFPFSGDWRESRRKGAGESKHDMRTAMLIRGGSISPGTEIAGRSPSGLHETSVDFHRRSWSMRMSLDVKEKRDLPLPTGTPNPIRRVRSDNDLLRSAPFSSRWSPPMKFEEEEEEEKAKLVMSMSPAIAEEAEGLVYSGGGMGNGRKIGGGSGGKRGGEANREGDPRIGTYYQEMLKMDPGNPLLLRNYGRFLHEVEGDLERAEEYYGRAILSSPNDGELLSLYGRLVWESQRDSKRAKSYHERAAEASPDDCYVMGSYAHFLWDAEEEEDEEEGRVASSSPFVEAF